MKEGIRKSVSWGGKAVMVALIAALVLPTLLMGPVGQVQAKAHPALLAMAAERPEARVRVIGQKIGEADIEALVEGLDGRHLKNLPIIDAFVAEMSAAAAKRLATSPSIAWVSLDGPVASAGKSLRDLAPEILPETFFLDTLNVRPVWDMGYDGSGIAVAVIDSGVMTDRDFSTEPGKPFTRIVKQLSFSANSNSTADLYGHGTHVAGIIAGHGGESAGLYSGVAPKAEVINLKVSDDDGVAYESDIVDAMQWVLDNKDAFNIRIANLSLNSTQSASYHASPMNAAAEILWFNGVVVVVAAGNYGGDEMVDTINSAPANDPFLIAVGAMDEKGTSGRSDDSVPTFSASGQTYDGHMKPEIYAPGRDIISVLADSSDWYFEHPDRVVMDGQYFRISGTSMAAPMVSGAAALLLQAEPNLTPDQVKYRLINSAGLTAGWRYLDVYAALTTPTTESANTGLIASNLLTTGSEPIDSSVSWNSVSWNSVSWNSVSWNSVSWNSVSWNAVSWNSVSWDD